MAKISPVAAKYIVHSTIRIEGVVDRPDVIGAVFGQTEGLLGNDLELRELQRSGRIGRIEVNVSTSSGKTNGEIIIPSSLDKTETAIIAAALEIIQRIGPCNAKIEVQKIEDVRAQAKNVTFVAMTEYYPGLNALTAFPEKLENSRLAGTGFGNIAPVLLLMCSLLALAELKKQLIWIICAQECSSWRAYIQQSIESKPVVLINLLPRLILCHT